MATPQSKVTKVNKPTGEEEIGDNAVKTMPGVPEGSIDRKPVDRDEANREAVGGDTVIEVTEADNPSPGRNAVPVTADLSTSGKVPFGDAAGDAEVDEEELVPGTSVPQTATPKAGDQTL